MTIDEYAEEYKGGWIACSERLPDNDKKQYIVQKTNGNIDILGFTIDAYKLSRYDFAEYKGNKKQLFYDYDSEYGYSEQECVAWQPLPEPYKAELKAYRENYTSYIMEDIQVTQNTMYNMAIYDFALALKNNFEDLPIIISKDSFLDFIDDNADLLIRGK